MVVPVCSGDSVAEVRVMPASAPRLRRSSDSLKKQRRNKNGRCGRYQKTRPTSGGVAGLSFVVPTDTDKHRRTRVTLSCAAGRSHNGDVGTFPRRNRDG